MSHVESLPERWAKKHLAYRSAIKLAHSLELKSLPPLVQLKVVEDDPPPRLGVDYFEAAPLSEKLADTAAAIARIYRGKESCARLL